MAYSEPERLQGRLQRRENQERQGISGHSGRSGATHSLVNPNSDRPKQGDETSETARHWNTSNAASIWADSVGDTEHNGLYGAEVGRSIGSGEDEGRLLESQRSDTDIWNNPRIIYCRDGKYRPIPTEPALFPLADGISNRVGILRGAGNAIVPQAAAEIIKAVM